MTFTETISLTKIDCGECGGSYAINERYRKQKEQVGHGWHCPYCKCTWGYFGNSENSRLKKLLEDKARELVASKCETVRERNAKEIAEAERIKLSKKLRRVDKGVCPCCNRTFTNLQRHMATKHPEKI
jgi:hypothetical protein